MNCYFMHDGGYGGFYILANSRGRAKSIACYELDIDFVQVRGYLVKTKPIPKTLKEGAIDLEDSRILRKLGLHYYDEDGKKIPYNW